MKRYQLLIAVLVIVIVGGFIINTVIQSNQPNQNPDEIVNSETSDNGDHENNNIQNEERFGLGTYNTEEVVEELLYIEENTEPVDAAYRKKIFVTGSTGGLGQLIAKYLLERGHEVVVHACFQKYYNGWVYG